MIANLLNLLKSLFREVLKSQYSAAMIICGIKVLMKNIKYQKYNTVDYNCHWCYLLFLANKYLPTFPYMLPIVVYDNTYECPLENNILNTVLYGERTLRKMTV